MRSLMRLSILPILVMTACVFDVRQLDATSHDGGTDAALPPDAAACAADETLCSGTCVNAASSAANCGRCRNACAAGEVCATGVCVAAACATGQMRCAGDCVDTRSDRANCGSCGNACGEAMACNAGHCECVAPLTACGSVCTNVLTDPAHCGSCTAAACEAPNSCSGGVCNSACGVGTTACGGMCINPQIDNDNCGACGNACGTSRRCLAGTCRPNNNTRATATVMTLADSETTVRGNSAGATHDGPAVSCTCTSGGDVWYRFSLSTEEIVYFDTAGSTFDTSLLVTNDEGDPIDEQSDLGSPHAGLCNDDALCPMTTDGFTGTRQSRTWGRLEAGTYYVVVGGCGAGGEFTLHTQHVRVIAGSEFEGYLGAGLATFSGTLPAFGVTAGSCGAATGTANGEQWRFFVTCGAAPQFFSLCRSDRGSFRRRQYRTDFDPVLYLRSGLTGMELACNDDGAAMGGSDCQGTDGDSAQYGSRLNDVIAPRGLNAIFVDSRSGGDATFARMEYSVAYFVRNAP